MYLSVGPGRQTPPAFRQSLQQNLQVQVQFQFQVQVQFQGVVPVPVQKCLHSGRSPHSRQLPQEFPLQQPQGFPRSAVQLLQSSPLPHPGELIWDVHRRRRRRQRGEGGGFGSSSWHQR